MKPRSRRSHTKNSVSGAFGASRGLAVVEEHIRRHDNAMISDYDEDINALLILGGLFSTILTAFIAVSLGWFAQDYTQTTAQLLQQISAQLANDSSRAIVAEPLPFEVASIDIAINILWFLSLVLCLAASLFGMIVKGWLREYSMWETEPAQDAIYLRQIRYNAFLQWKVPLIVALLPGLLELALVLFMVGIVAMLWTLNSHLALVVTVVSAGFAVVAFSMVVIPAFFPHCPYRSPAGWTCVLLWNTLACVLFRLLWSTGRCSRRLLQDRLDRYRELEDWKKRDFYIDVLAHNDRYMGSRFELHTSKLQHLIDALAWSFERCQDDTILRYLHFAVGEEMSPDIRLHLPLYTACRKFSIDSEAFFTSIHLQYSEGDEHNPGAYKLSLPHRPDILDPSVVPDGSIFLEILGLILLDQVQSFVRLLEDQGHTPAKPLELSYFVDALCFLYRVARLSPFSRLKTAYADFLVELYHQATTKEDDGGRKRSSIRRFRTFIVEILMKLGSIRLLGSQVSVDLEYAHMTFRDYMQLAINVFRENSGYTDPESRHLFVTFSNLAILHCVWYTNAYNQKDLSDIMQCIEAAIRASLKYRIPNCGYYAHLPWIDSLLRAAHSSPNLYAHIPPSLLNALEESVSAGLVAGVKTWEQLNELRKQCPCHGTVVIAPTPEASQEGEEEPRVPAQTDGQAALRSREPSPLPPSISSYDEPQQDGGYDSSCQTPLLNTPSSGTLTDATPNLPSHHLEATQVVSTQQTSSDQSSRWTYPSPSRQRRITLE